MSQTPSQLEIPLDTLTKGDNSKVNSQRSQNPTGESEGLFDFTAPKDPKANPIPNQDDSARGQCKYSSAQPSPQSSSRSQSKQGKPAIPKVQSSSFSLKSPKNSPHASSPKTLLNQQQISPVSSSSNRSKEKNKSQPTLVEVEEEEEEEVHKEKEDINDVINDLLKGTRDLNSIDHDSRPTVITSLQKFRDDHLFDHDVDTAQHAHELATTLQNMHTFACKQQFQKEIEKSISTRLDTAQKDFEELQQRCKRTMRLLKQKHRKDMEQLEERQINEMNEFVLKWQKPGTIRKYSAASGQLRHMRNQTIAMIITRRFDDLRATDKAVKALEQQERNEQFRQMSMGYESQLHQLEEKHNTEKVILTNMIERKEGELQSAIDWEIQCASNRINSLQNSLNATQDVEKVWNLHRRHKKTTPQKVITTAKLSKTALLNRVDMHSLNTVDLPPLGDPRAQSQHGFRRRMQAPVMLIK